jgi:hypothetical protein
MRSFIAAVLAGVLLLPCVVRAQSSTAQEAATAPAQDAPTAPVAGVGQAAQPTAPVPSTGTRAPRKTGQAQREERDSLEPAVDTSATAPAESSAPAGGQVAASAKLESPAGDGSASSGTHPKASSGKAMDHLELGTTDITGNRELPKVLYIVPWKRSDLGDLTGKPLNSLVDEALQPIDRDVFKRENRYYGAVAQKASPSGNSGTGSAADADRNGSRQQHSSAGDER